jgi:O-antigen/teichoic acid export membrane protein
VKRTRLDLTKRTVAVTAGQTVAKLSAFVVAMLLVRILTDVEWATIALILSIYSVGIGLGGLSLQQSIFFFYGRLQRPERRGFAVQTTVLLATAGAVAAGIVLALHPWLSSGPYRVEGLLPWLALTLVLEVPTLGAPQLLLAVERPGQSGAFTAAASLAQILGVTIPVVLGFGMQGAMVGLTVYASLRFLAYLALVVLLTPPGPVRIEWALVKEQLVYTAPLGLSMGTAILNRNIGKWFVAAFDAPDFGAYAIAANEVPFVSIVPYAIGAVLATRIVHAFKTQRKELALASWQASTSGMSLLVVPAAIGVVLCAPQIIVILFTSSYAAATLPFQVHTIVLLHRVAEYGIVLRAAGDTRSLWWASVILLVANVLLSLPLTLTIGMLGAALGMLGANLVAWLYILSRIGRVMELGIGAVFPWGLYGRVLGVASVAALVAWQVSSLAPPAPVMQLVLRAVVFTILFVAATHWLQLRRAVPSFPEDDPEFAHDTETGKESTAS